MPVALLSLLLDFYLLGGDLDSLAAAALADFAALTAAAAAATDFLAAAAGLVDDDDACSDSFSSAWQSA